MTGGRDHQELRRLWSQHHDLDAAWDLATDLASSGRRIEARGVHAEMIAAGYLIGYLGLAWIEHDRGDDDAAEAMLVRYLDEREPEDLDADDTLLVQGVLGHWRWRIHGRVDAEPLLRRGQSQYPSARADLAHLLIATGRQSEAREHLRGWIDAGDEGCCLVLGNLQQEAGEYEDAERLYVLGYERGDAYSARNLALMMDLLDRRDQAMEWMRRAAEGGDMLAVRDLAAWDSPSE